MKVLKKGILVMLACATMLSLCACGGNDKNETNAKKESNKESIKKEKAVDTFAGVFLTSGKDNESQRVINEKKLITVSVDKEKDDFTVDGLNGIGMVITHFGEGEDRYVTELYYNDNKFGNLEKNDFIYGDGVPELNVNIGTIIYVDLKKDEYVYANPMFRKSNGEIYIKSAEEPYKVLRNEHSTLDNAAKVNMGEECEIYMTTADFVMDGVPEFEVEFKISFVNRKPAEKVVINAVDKDDKVIKKFEFKPDKVPEKIDLVKGATSYEIEEHVKYEDRGPVTYFTVIDDLVNGYGVEGYYKEKEEIFLLESLIEIGEESDSETE